MPLVRKLNFVNDNPSMNIEPDLPNHKSRPMAITIAIIGAVKDAITIALDKTGITFALDKTGLGKEEISPRRKIIIVSSLAMMTVLTFFFTPNQLKSDINAKMRELLNNIEIPSKAELLNSVVKAPTSSKHAKLYSNIEAAMSYRNRK